MRDQKHDLLRKRCAGLSAVCLLLLSGCGMFGYGESEYEQLKNKQQEFTDLVAAAGGSAVLEFRQMYGQEAEGWMIDLSGAELTPELIEAICDFAKTKPVLQFNLSGSSVTDADLLKFDSGNVLQKTVSLDLSDTSVTDAGLDGMSNHYIISELKLKGSQATAAAAKRLGDRQIASPQTPRPFKKQPKLDI